MDQLTNLENAPFYLIILTGLISGLVGSTHCIGMCGGLVLATTESRKGVFIYHAGRLLGYLTLGVALPLLGINALGLKHNHTLALISAISIGSIFIFIGLKNIFNLKSYFIKHDFLEKLNHKIWKNIFLRFKNYKLTRSFLAGSSSVLLPCGLLWSILILSLTTTSVIYSLLFIFSFWMATLPGLTFAPEVIKKLFTPLFKSLPKAMPLVLIFIGATTIAYRVNQLFIAQTCH